MIAALNTFRHHFAMGQGCATVTASIFQGANRAGRVAKQHQGLIHDGTAHQAAIEFFRPSGQILGVANEGFKRRVSHVELLESTDYGKPWMVP